MKLFISWSGERSRKLAEGLRSWIPQIINAAEPWLSSKDISAGARWNKEVSDQLQDTGFGIICLSKDNLDAPWIHFEAGSLSKAVDKSFIVPLLLDIKPSDIQGPLSQFQAVQANKDGVNKLVSDINTTIITKGEKGNSGLENVFEKIWPELEDVIKTIPAIGKPLKSIERSEREMIEEILDTVRQLQRQVSSASDLSPGITLNDMARIGAVPGYAYSYNNIPYVTFPTQFPSGVITPPTGFEAEHQTQRDSSQSEKQRLVNKPHKNRHKK